MNVILLEPGEIQGSEAVLDGPRAVHITTVLRAGPGATLRVGVLNGALGTAEVLGVEHAGLVNARVALRLALESEAPPTPRVDLILALPRPKVLARLYSPIAQLGVRRLMLTGAYKVERAYFDTHVLTPETWRPLLIEGLAQSRDTRIPVVTVHRSPTWLVREELASLVPEPALRLVADPAASCAAQVAVRASSAGRIVLAIGPEGGWAPREERLFDAHGFERVVLGPRTLRSDVAVIALLSLVHGALNE